MVLGFRGAFEEQQKQDWLPEPVSCAEHRTAIP